MGWEPWNFKFQISGDAKTLDDFFPSIQALINRVIGTCAGKGTRYPMELVEVRTNWPTHHDYQKKRVIVKFLGWWIFCCEKTVSQVSFQAQKLRGDHPSLMIIFINKRHVTHKTEKCNLNLNFKMRGHRAAIMNSLNLPLWIQTKVITLGNFPMALDLHQAHISTTQIWYMAITECNYCPTHS